MNTIDRLCVTLCRTAMTDVNPVCPECLNGQCSMWPQFKREAEAAFAAIRDEFILSRRNKRRGA